MRPRSLSALARLAAPWPAQRRGKLTVGRDWTGPASASRWPTVDELMADHHGAAVRRSATSQQPGRGMWPRARSRRRCCPVRRMRRSDLSPRARAVRTRNDALLAARGRHRCKPSAVAGCGRRRHVYDAGEPRLPSPERERSRGSSDRRRPGRVGGTFSSASLDEHGTEASSTQLTAHLIGRIERIG